jgi:4-amino-4-deoxy-L-arabinose transferase-like glycosyltransferase
VERKAVWWFLAGLGYLSLWSYTTPVYFSILLIPMSILTVAVINRIATSGWPELALAKWQLIIWFIPGYLLAHYIFVYYGRDWFLASHSHKIVLTMIGLAVTGVALWSWKNIQRFSPKTVLTVIVLLFLAADFSPYVKWLAHPRYTVAAASQDLQQKVGEGTVAGSWAPALCLETKLKEFPFWENIVNDQNLTKTIPVTHLLLERNYFDLEFVQRAYPEILAGARIIETYDINNRMIDLWKLNYDQK